MKSLRFGGLTKSLESGIMEASLRVHIMKGRAMNFFCKIGWHRWSAWTEFNVIFQAFKGGSFIPTLKRKKLRYCKRCRVTQEVNV